MTSNETWRNRIKNTNNPIMKNIPTSPCPQNQIWDHCPHAAAIRNAMLDEIQQHAIKAGFVRYDDKGRICNYTYINPKILLQKIQSPRTQEHP
jgi:hypothetical protein